MSRGWDDDDGLEPEERDGYADAMYAKADHDRKAMKESGEWFRNRASGLSLGEFRRRELEDEASAAGVDDAAA